MALDDEVIELLNQLDTEREKVKKLRTFILMHDNGCHCGATVLADTEEV